MNNNYTCFYDRTSVTNVQWFRPNERPALAMLIVGFSVAGAVVLVILVGQIWGLIKERLASANPPVQF